MGTGLERALNLCLTVCLLPGLLQASTSGGYTQPGTNGNRAVAYNYGQGPKVQQLPGSLAEMRVPSNTSSLIIDKLQPTAEGLYTCQALYDRPEGPKVAFHYVQLDVLEEGEPGSAHL
ncbi:hypothetical protein SKAU_G00086900 [Synaphobranchus kaupii]|uniref:Uncharacterized protein n=1 Tax=Synaphobranchus kaupii TaxID=118154 RepID=A0A9Q1FWB6_SYNKA|nr:hypothetical protein SKAU_G00086900 [Synaphobranchus kaupii]